MNKNSVIYLSGGWGYRNLGDDAILLATIKQLRKQMPDAKLRISSYLPAETREIVENAVNVEVVPSFHRIVFGEWMRYGFCTPERWSTWFKIKYKFTRTYQNIRAKTLYWMLEKFPIFTIFVLQTLHPSITKQLKGVDAVLLAGGGYINENVECNIAHILEVALCKKRRIPTGIDGQTIGPFERGRTRRLMKHWLNECKHITLRDEDSKQELESIGIGVKDEVVPDIALTDICVTQTKDKALAIVPFFDMEPNITDMANAIERFHLSHPEYHCVITSSQQWTQIWQTANKLHLALLERAVPATFVYPSNVFELQDVLCKCEIVLSQNLHGLIMAYRAGCKIVSLNNRRKFKTFMQQVCSDSRCFGTNVNYDELLTHIDNVLSGNVGFVAPGDTARHAVGSYKDMICRLHETR